MIGKIFRRHFSKYILAIDEGTTSCRAVLFNSSCKAIEIDQKSHRQITPRPGWVENDPIEVMNNVKDCINQVIAKAEQRHGIKPKDIIAAGVTNQRETTIPWSRKTGLPLHNAIVWLDSRTYDIANQIAARHNNNINHFQRKCGLPIHSYFSALKMKWLLENSQPVAKAAREGDLCFGTVDSWINYNLTGRKVHAIDVTNASRTMLMDIHSLKWDEEICREFGVPMNSLPEIRTCSELFGNFSSEFPSLHGLPITGVIGDQQSACLGHLLQVGEAKCTYGTGCFVLMNTGNNPIFSSNMMLSTLCYKLGPNAKPFYALEGSIEMGGASIMWAKSSLQLFKDYEELTTMASGVKDSGDVYFIPAFSGLYAPHWRSDARGLFIGLTQHTTRAHLLRAIIDGMCFRVNEVIKAMEKDSLGDLVGLKVDGGVTVNDFIMQTQANVLEEIVERKTESELTALGCAIAAGMSKETKLWDSLDSIKGHVKVDKTFTPVGDMTSYRQKWHEALQRSLNWVK